MKNASIATTVLAMLALAQAVSAAPPRQKELGYEAAASMVRLPASENGELTYQGCDTCKVLRLRATPNTRYIIGTERVTLAELTRYIEQHSNTGMLVAQLNGTNDLARIQVYVPPAN